MSGPCVGCGRPARVSGVCAECRTENERELRAREDRLFSRLETIETRDRFYDHGDAA